MSELTGATVVARPTATLGRRLLANQLTVAGVVLLLLIVMAAMLGPLIVPWNPLRASVSEVLLQPSSAHLLGTDASGRDILARLLVGTRLTLTAAAVVVAVSLLIGVSTGLVAGYRGGWFDAVASWFASMTLALPNLVVVLAFVTIAGPNTYLTMLIFGVLFSTGPFRLTRSTVRAVRGELYVDAARVSGLSEARIITRHILTAVRGPIIVMGATIAGIAIVLQAGLDFLGVSDRTQPTWGQMLSEAFASIYRAPLQVLWPGLAIGLTVAALLVIANGIRDELTGGTTGTVSGGAARRRRRAHARLAPVAPVAPVDAVDAARPSVVLTVRGLTVAFGADGPAATTAVDGIDLDLRRGEVLGIVGESGSGKTQTALAVLGLLPGAAELVAGTISFEGFPLNRRSRMLGHRIGYVPQEPLTNLDPSFTIGQQLTEPLREHLHLSRSAARARALELLSRVGLPDPERTFASYPHQISGGMAQRVLIAGAISCDPALLIADEPTTALDVTVQAEILDLLRDLQAERQLAVLLITHDIGVVADLCDRVAVMSAGRIVETGATRQTLAEPQHAVTRALLASALETEPPRARRDEALR